MKFARANRWLWWLLAAVVIALLLFFAPLKATAMSGWILFCSLLALGAFNSRKKFSMLPIGKASVWLALHVALGIAALALFWWHMGRLWPLGFYEQMLAALFYLSSVSGIFGFVLQKIYPRMLTNTGVEIIYERIPAEVASLREQAEALVLDCTKQTGSDTLARHYLETLDWYFRRPRFFASAALGSHKARAWQREQCATVRRYLDDKELPFLDKLTTLAAYKTDVDFHYALQTVMKVWLLAHLPLAVATIALAVWHIIVVHVYAL